MKRHNDLVPDIYEAAVSKYTPTLKMVWELENSELFTGYRSQRGFDGDK